MDKYILKLDTTSQTGIQIDFAPNNYILSSFLRYLQTLQFPYFLLELTANRSFGVENAWFTYYWEMDGGFLMDFKNKYGREMQEDEIEIRFYDGKAN